MAQSSEPGLRLAELVAALSLATDLGTGQPMEHALRTCGLAVRLGDTLGLGDSELRDVYYVALLRSAGCTAESPLEAAVFGDEITARAWLAMLDVGRPSELLEALVRRVGAGAPLLRRARMVATALATLPKLPGIEASHCEVAQQLAGRLGLGSAVQRALGQVFERWDGRGLPHRIKGEELATAVRVVAFANDAVLFFRAGGVEAAVAVARRRAGSAYDPWIVECFCREAPRLLAGLDQGSAWEAALAAEPGRPSMLSEEQLDTAAGALADFADLVSPYLLGHSSAVGELAAAAARHWRLPPADVVAIRRAGFLHDIGRVGVSAGVWGKPGPLNDGDWERVRLHAYFTERILVRARALAPLSALAALHHERLDGSGYHRGASAAQLPVTARILAVADVYQALTEPRPHRAARSPDVAVDVLRGDVRAGRLDGEAVDAVLAAAGHRVRRRRRAWPAGLSNREVEVLRLVVRGLPNRTVAERLVIAEGTVHQHVQHIYDKLGVSTRAAAALFAMQHDLLSDAFAIGPAEK